MRKILLILSISLLIIGCSKKETQITKMSPDGVWDLTRYREYDENGSVIRDAGWIIDQISFGEGYGPVTANKGKTHYKGTYLSQGSTIKVEFTDHPELEMSGEMTYSSDGKTNVLSITQSENDVKTKLWLLEQPITVRHF